MSPTGLQNSGALAVRIFLASPGDVADERALVRRVIDQLGYDPYLRGRIAIELVAWDRPGADTPLLATMTPQEAISKQLPKPSECDVVVVIFWSRMGTRLPPEYVKPDGSGYLSGSEWEYLDARAASEASGSPKVLVYRRTEVPAFQAEDPEIEDRLAQWRSVKDFFATFRNSDGSIRNAYNEYDTPDTFENKLDRHLRVLLSQILEEGDSTSEFAQQTDFRAGRVVKAESPIWPGSPFPGLRAFGPDDAPIFYGRGLETDGLVRRVADGQRFIAAVGVSGSGKSSLVSAGLLPRLADNAVPGSKDWVVKRITPGEFGDDPFIALAHAFHPVLESRNQSVREAARTLEETPAEIDELADALLTDHPEWAEVLLFVDQFEELFTVTAEEHRQAFSQLIATAAESPRLRVILTLRGDFYHRCIALPELARLLRTGSYPLTAPGPAALEEMISRPAERAGLEFDPVTLPRKILTDTGSEPGALPLMAFALAELYAARTEDGKLTESAYKGFDGVQGAIGKRAEQTFQKLDTAAQQALPSVFSQLVEVGEATEAEKTKGGWVATRRRAPWDALMKNKGAATLIDGFIEARLLVGGRGGNGEPVIEVAHEAMLQNWERLRNWIADRGGDIQLIRSLHRAAEDWKSGEGDLWRRTFRREAEAAMARLGAPPQDPVPDFIAASRLRTRWRLTMLVGATFVVLVGIIGEVALSRKHLTWPHVYAAARSEIGLWPPIEPDMELVSPEKGHSMNFEMGNNSSHPVSIENAYFIGRYEVTFAEYARFALATWRQMPDDNGWQPREQRPVINVSWRDAVDYAKWLSTETGKKYRLPSEAEWEYATRAETTTRFSSGACINTDQANYDGRLSYRNCPATDVYRGKTVEVGSLGFPNRWGLYDVHGNVWEWVQDCWHENYDGAPNDGSAWGMAGSGDCGQGVLRGGSWISKPSNLRSTNRNKSHPENRRHNIGFRLAQSLD